MANTTKVQPGLEAETAVIGALIYAPEIVKDVLFAVREQDFGIEINRKIFRAARDLYLRAKPVTAVTIRDKVGQESSDYLAQLYQLTMTSANWREYAAIMAEQAASGACRSCDAGGRSRHGAGVPRAGGEAPAGAEPAGGRSRPTRWRT